MALLGILFLGGDFLATSIKRISLFIWLSNYARPGHFTEICSYQLLYCLLGFIA